MSDVDIIGDQAKTSKGIGVVANLPLVVGLGSLAKDQVPSDDDLLRHGIPHLGIVRPLIVA
jgi:hypothetical protein